MTVAPFADTFEGVLPLKIGVAPVFSQPFFPRGPVTNLLAYQVGAKAVALAETRFNDEALTAMGAVTGSDSVILGFHHPLANPRQPVFKFLRR